MKDEWTKEYLEYEKETILDQISDELEAMSMNDFSNLVEKHDLRDRRNRSNILVFKRKTL
jgi:hypothetical protein